MEEVESVVGSEILAEEVPVAPINDEGKLDVSAETKESEESSDEGIVGDESVDPEDEKLE